MIDALDCELCGATQTRLAQKPCVSENITRRLVAKKERVHELR
jgi:hypothetical protein